uniref:LNS2/PITP domain-containing protein n=1 Tax=Grammatophora oceanica TaxID=210454 RepID=A0A7S1VHV5_9STRA|mmetsp:Transcript_4544/g.6296  ORF Transcript_4544/g.6296 Transcript_4544/m.6296 type:complete len:372 (+) Transcript_4544:172-1287(+)
MEGSPCLISLACCTPSSTAMGEAFDVVIVVDSIASATSTPACCDFTARFKPSLSHCKIQIVVNDKRIPSLDGCLDPKTGDVRFIHSNTTKPSPELLREAVLSVASKGRNCLQYQALTKEDEILSIADAHLFVWELTDKVFVSDIDGTLTTSNLRGIVNTVMTDNFQQDASTLHHGICNFYENFLQAADQHNVTVRLVYLTSRPLELASVTRRFLTTVAQNGVELPAGPLVGHPGTLMDVLNSELFKRDIHRHKADRLMRFLRLVYAGAGATADSSPLVGAIGNTMTDTTAYEMGGVPLNHIYLIDPSSRIRCFDTQGLGGASHGEEQRRKQSKTASPMRPIRSHRSYKRLMNTTFEGYDDPSFLDHARRML